MKIIQMGIGGMGNAWLERLMPLDFVEFVGFVEVSDKVAKEQAEAYDLDPSTIFKRLPDALDKVDADAVISVIPPEYRTETLKTCIDANLPLLAEKPLAETLEDAQTQVDLANESGLLYFIAQDYRYKPSLYTVKQILDNGDLGKIDAITVSHYWGFVFEGFRAEMPYPLMNDMAVHHFDLLRYFLGTEPTTLYGKSWSPDWNVNSGKMSAHALLTFPDDVQVAYTASWVATGMTTTFDGDWRIDCEKGVLTYMNDIITVQMRDDLHKPQYRYLPSEHYDPLELEMNRQAFLAHEMYQYLENGTVPATTVQDNFKTLEMVFDVIESSETGQVIQKG